MYSQITEAQFQDQVLRLAQMNQWLVDHTPPMMTRGGGYRTGGLAGKPDLLLISLRGHGIIHAELKTMTGRLTPAQNVIGNALLKNNAEYYVWRPNQLELIAKRLSGALL